MNSPAGTPDLVLVVEDNAVSRKLMRVTLSSSGFRVAEAADGKSALDAAGREPPALVLQDIQLPDIDGYELVGQIRRLPGLAEVPVLAVTGFLSRLDAAHVQGVGFTDYLVKPIDPSRLVATVRSRLHLTAESAPEAVGRQRRVLVVDDDPVQRKLLSVRFQYAGFQVSSAADGVEALDAVRSGRFEAVVADVLMPHLDGFQLCRRIRDEPSLERLAIVLVTSAYLEEADRSLALACGADAYCVRTPDADDVLACLLSSLDSPTRRPAATQRKPPVQRYVNRVVRQLEHQVTRVATLERRLAIAEAEVAILAGLADTLRTAADPETALAAVLYRTIDAAGLSWGAVYLNAADGSLRLSARCGLSEPEWNSVERVLKRHDALRRVVQSGEFVSLPAAGLPAPGAESSDASSARAPSEANGLRRSVLLGPISAGREVVGVLLVASAEREIAGDWRSFASAVGSHVGYAIGLSRGLLRLADSERRFRDLVDGVDAVVWEVDPQTLRFTFVSRRAEDVFGYAPDKWTASEAFWDVLHGDAAASPRTALEAAIRRGDASVEFDAPARTAAGRLLQVRHRVRILYDGGGRAAQVRGVTLDVTVREQNARRTAAQLAVTAALAESPGLPEAAPRILRAMCTGLGWSVASLWLPAEPEGLLRCSVAEGSGDPWSRDVVRTLLGATVPASRGLAGRVHAARAPIWVADAAREIAPPIPTGATLPRLGALLGFPVQLGDRFSGMVILADTAARALEDDTVRTTASIGSQIGQFAERQRAEERLRDRARLAAFSAEVASAFNRGETLSEMLAACADAMVRHVDAVLARIWLVDRSHTALELRASAGVPVDLQGARERIPLGSAGLGQIASGRQAHVTNSAAEDPLNLDRDWARRESIAAFAAYPLKVQDEVVGLMAVFARHRFDDFTVRALASATDVISVGVHRKAAREEKVALEDELRQSQKLEAIGRLAGGVAHDFNNLLTLITGYCNFARSDLEASHPAAKSIAEIERAAQRAADLTHQLLAFSRKQVLLPTFLDLNEVVGEVVPMIRRLVGEDVDVRTSMHADPLWVRADRGQIEQVLVNLVVNARDSMQAGGCVEIETEDVLLDEDYVREHPESRPGRHAVLVVRDDGSGMAPEVAEHIFEPFFTTKGPGKGTGLGLATVHGIVRQSGGHIAVETNRGEGTTFRVHLPRVDDGDGVVSVSDEKPREMRGTETVLVVEDEDPLREMVLRVLRHAGYVVLDAPEGESALRVVERHQGKLDLVITDAVMPKMGGREFAAKLSKVRPGVPVVTMSGYPDAATAQSLLTSPGTPFLRKPFTPAELLRAVRDTLDRAART